MSKKETKIERIPNNRIAAHIFTTEVEYLILFPSYTRASYNVCFTHVTNLLQDKSFLHSSYEKL